MTNDNDILRHYSFLQILIIFKAADFTFFLIQMSWICWMVRGFCPSCTIMSVWYVSKVAEFVAFISTKKL